MHGARHEARERARGLRGVTLGERQVLGATAVSAIHDGAMAASEGLDLANTVNRSDLDWLARDQDGTPGCLAPVNLVCDEPAAAALLEQRAIPQCFAQGRAVEVSYAQAWLATATFRQGALREAETIAQTALEIITAAGAVAPVVHWAATGALMPVLLARGDVAEAAAVLDAWTRRGWDPAVAVFSWPEPFRAEGLVAQGHLAEGVQRLLAVGRWLENRGFTNPAYIPWRARTAPALAALGRGEEARALIGPAVVRARAFGSAWGLGMALRAAGTVEPGARGLELLREPIRPSAVAVPAGVCARAARARSRAAARQPARRGAGASAGGTRHGASLRRGAASAAGGAGARRNGCSPAAGDAHRGRVADCERATNCRVGGHRSFQPPHRPAAVRLAEDRGDASRSRLPEAGMSSRQQLAVALVADER